MGTLRQVAQHGPMNEIRALIVSDNRVLADALATRLGDEPGVFPVAVVSSGAAARRALAGRQVDVVLLDLDQADGDGLELCRSLQQDRPQIRIVALTGAAGARGSGEERPLVVRAVRAGVRGWVSKADSVEHLITVLRGVAAGETWIPPRLLSEVLGSYDAQARSQAEGERLLDSLTPREREVLMAMTAGMSRAEVAAALYLSTNTVRTHVQNVLRKLGAHSSLGAVAIARRAGLEGEPMLPRQRSASSADLARPATNGTPPGAAARPVPRGLPPVQGPSVQQVRVAR